MFYGLPFYLFVTISASSRGGELQIVRWGTRDWFPSMDRSMLPIDKFSCRPYENDGLPFFVSSATAQILVDRLSNLDGCRKEDRVRIQRFDWTTWTCCFLRS